MPIVWALIIILHVGADSKELLSDKRYDTHGECQWVGQAIQEELEQEGVRVEWKCVELENYEDLSIKALPFGIN